LEQKLVLVQQQEGEEPQGVSLKKKQGD